MYVNAYMCDAWRDELRARIGVLEGVGTKKGSVRPNTHTLASVDLAVARPEEALVHTQLLTKNVVVCFVGW